MSDNIFESADQQNTSPTEEAVQPNTEDNSVAAEIPEELKEFVGEGKKYKSVEDALRSIPHAQQHINNLEKEKQEMREDLEKRLNAEETLKKILERQEGSDSADTPSDELTPDVVKNLAKSAYEELTQEELQKKNITSVDSTLREKWGDKAGEQLKAKADELGVSLEFMQQTAAHSPQAFYNLVGLNNSASAKPDHTTAPRQGDVDSSSMASSSAVEPGTYKWYQQLRRNDPKQYYSSKVQLQMHRDAAEKGDSFYN